MEIEEFFGYEGVGIFEVQKWIYGENSEKNRVQVGVCDNS
jgi:hypothetical protein